MRGHDYMEKADINWAWTRLVVGKRNSPWLALTNTLGGLLLGAGIPILVTPLISEVAPTTGGSLLGSGLSIFGIALLSASMTMSFFRR